MIEFVTLLLGLAVGPEDIEVTVSEDVAGVELTLDSEPCGRADGPPWVIRCDFGPILVPRRLEAIARAGDGRELARAEQWANLPRARAEATLSLEAAPDGRPRRARLIWEAIDFERPTRVDVRFDGKVLSSFDGEWIELPNYEGSAFHILSAELEFSERVTARADVAFGGAYGDRVSTDLTAIAAEATRRRPPPLAELQGKLLVEGRPLEVVAAERSPLDLVIVREQTDSLFGAIRRLVAVGGAQRIPARSLLPPILAPADRAFFVFPTASAVQGRSALFEIMPVSKDVTQMANPPADRFRQRPAEGVTLFKILTGMNFPNYSESLPRQRLADAVAVGGLVASTSNRRRAVLLMRTGEAVDAGRVTPPVARHYLNSLAVPLTIWTLRPPGEPGPNNSPGWGAGEILSDWGELAAAFRKLRAQLDRQFIIWVDGRHPPQAIELASDVKSFRLARRPSEELDAALAKATLSARDLAVPAPEASPPAEGADSQEPGVVSERGLTLTDVDRIDRARRHLGSAPFTPRLGPVHLLTDLSSPRLIRSLHRIAIQAPGLYAEHFGVSADLSAGATAILFAEEGSYRAFEAEELGAAGKLAGHAIPGMITLYAGTRAQREIEATFLHELVHLLNLRAFGPDLAPWLDEGLADAMTLATARGGRLVLEPLDRKRPATGVRALEGPLSQLGPLLEAAETDRLPTLEELTRLDRAAFRTRDDAALLYALSALWVHYLSAETAEDGALFREFLSLQAQAPTEAGEALPAALGTSFGELEGGFRRWLEGLGRVLLAGAGPGR